MTVGELNAYMAGLQAGYWSRIGEENERWRVASQWRPNLPTGPSFRERDAARIAVLEEAHAAGLHDGRTATAARAGCPGCAA